MDGPPLVPDPPGGCAPTDAIAFGVYLPAGPSGNSASNDSELRLQANKLLPGFQEVLRQPDKTDIAATASTAHLAEAENSNFMIIDPSTIYRVESCVLSVNGRQMPGSGFVGYRHASRQTLANPQSRA
jgi:hypothetical protein